jgi:hypothetical protein
MIAVHQLRSYLVHCTALNKTTTKFTVNTQLLAWIAIAAAVVCMPLLTLLLLRWRRSAAKVLPAEWAITARAVFTSDERRIYRLLREALPHHVILSKLPLVRFCQPVRAKEVRYWYELLGAGHLTFAICSANGRVLAAVDLEIERPDVSVRAVKIKQAVLDACRIKHMLLPLDHVPTIAEFQALVPDNLAVPRPTVSTPAGQVNIATPAQFAPHPVQSIPKPAAPVTVKPTLDQARDHLASTVATRRAQRAAIWQDSAIFQDSFFAMDEQLSTPSASDFMPMISLDVPEPRGRSS